ncbi:MAG: tetratricopeptide repeat protein [Candidatus Tritonobacter lacicola]|nr:tetratricopeptide repeat protein [Candidatus Tritonobacter lacicola]
MSERKIRYLVLFAVIATTALVHSGCLFLGFNSFWDLIHVYRNPFQSSISLELAGRAFTRVVEAEYTPFRSLSNSLDYTLWGNNALGHHLTSYLIFLFSTALVFVLVERLMDQARYPFKRRIFVAGLTALLFGIHPLKVQVVAWVTTRDYQLGAFFYLLCVLIYTKWLRSESIGWYVLAVLFALCASLSQAMAVSLPLGLILLDYYPLNRFKEVPATKLLVEKAPFVLIALLTAVVTGQIRHNVQTLHPMDLSSLMLNGLEFPAALVFYLYKTVFPLHLAPIYPMESTGDPGFIIFSWVVITGLVVVAAKMKKEHPAFFTGVLISIVMLLPAGGLVRSGATVLADRYVQLASLPLLLGIAWLITGSLRSPRFRCPVAVLGLAWIVFLVWKTVTYTALWDDAVGLTRQAYARYPQSRIIELFMLRSYNNAAAGLTTEGKFDEAFDACRKAIEVNPAYPDTYTQLGIICLNQGKEEEGIRYFRKATELDPRDADSFFNLGLAWKRVGNRSEAIAAFERVLMLDPHYARARHNLTLLRAPEPEYEKRKGQWPQRGSKGTKITKGTMATKRHKKAVYSY